MENLLDETAVDGVVLTCGIIDGQVHSFKADSESNQKGYTNGCEFHDVSNDSGEHDKEESNAIMKSDEVEALVQSEEKANTCETLLSLSVGLELMKLLVDVETQEADEACNINEVPKVCEVLHSLLSELDPFKQNEENLSEEADGIQDVQQEHTCGSHCTDKWNHKSECVERQLEHQEFGN